MEMFLSKTDSRHNFHTDLLSSKSLLLLFPATIFLMELLVLSLLLWLLGQHMYSINTHTHTGRHSATRWCYPRHTSVTLAAWLCKLIPLQAQLLLNCSGEVSSVAPSPPAAGHTGRYFLSIFQHSADSLVETHWLPCLLAYVCLGRKCPSSVVCIKTCTY